MKYLSFFRTFRQPRRIAAAIVVVWAGFHLSCIALHALVTGHQSYKTFYDIKTPSPAFELAGRVIGHPVYAWYAKLTGTNCGYGFFAPNVRSGGVLTIESGTKLMMPSFVSHEASVRFDGFIGDMVNDLAPEAASRERDSTMQRRQQEYNKVLLKNVSLQVMRENRVESNWCESTYCVVDFPSLAEARETGSAEVRLVPMKKLLLFRQ